MCNDEFVFTVIDLSDLDQDQRQVLAYDVAAVRDEIGGTSDEAERILLQRIGGQGNLPSYVKTLMVPRDLASLPYIDRTGRIIRDGAPPAVRLMDRSVPDDFCTTHVLFWGDDFSELVFCESKRSRGWDGEGAEFAVFHAPTFSRSGLAGLGTSPMVWQGSDRRAYGRIRKMMKDAKSTKRALDMLRSAR